MAYKQVTEPMEEIVELKKEVVKPQQRDEVFEVVAKLPVQEIRKYKREDGVIVNFVTMEEATEMINARI
jgi:hypothetical protein